MSLFKKDPSTSFVKRKTTFLEWLRSKAALQIFSLIVAIAAWAFVNSSRDIKEDRVVHIDYTNLPKGLVFRTTPVKEVKARLTGSLYRLRSVRDENLNYPIDLSNFHAGSHRVEILPDVLHLPLDVEVRSFEPRAVFVDLEEVLVRNIPVKPILIGSLKEGLSVSRIHLRPEILAVSGPRSIVSKMSSVDVPISLTGHDSSFSMSITPPSVFPGTEALDTVSVEVEVQEAKAQKQIRDVPAVPEPARPGVQISPPSGNLTIEGPDADVQQAFRNLKIIVPVEGLKKGRYRIRGHVDLPASLKVVNLDPQNFIVEISE